MQKTTVEKHVSEPLPHITLGPCQERNQAEQGKYTRIDKLLRQKYYGVQQNQNPDGSLKATKAQAPIESLVCSIWGQSQQGGLVHDNTDARSETQTGYIHFIPNR